MQHTLLASQVKLHRRLIKVPGRCLYTPSPAMPSTHIHKHTLTHTHIRRGPLCVAVSRKHSRQRLICVLNLATLWRLCFFLRLSRIFMHFDLWVLFFYWKCRGVFSVNVNDHFGRCDFIITVSCLNYWYYTHQPVGMALSKDMHYIISVDVICGDAYKCR